jgi:hypothetical protein
MTLSSNRGGDRRTVGSLLLSSGYIAALFFRGRERSVVFCSKLILGVNERHVREADKTKNVAEVGFLKIERFLWGALS